MRFYTSIYHKNITHYGVTFPTTSSNINRDKSQVHQSHTKRPSKYSGRRSHTHTHLIFSRRCPPCREAVLRHVNRRTMEQQGHGQSPPGTISSLQSRRRLKYADRAKKARICSYDATTHQMSATLPYIQARLHLIIICLCDTNSYRRATSTYISIWERTAGDYPKILQWMNRGTLKNMLFLTV